MNFSKQFLILLVPLVFVVSGCQDYNNEQIPNEYGVLYVETEGEFIDPVGADAPVIYSWTTEEQRFKGNLELISTKLSINYESLNSYSEFEVLVLNQLSMDGWHLHSFQVSSTPVAKDKIRTAYRYILSRRNR